MDVVSWIVDNKEWLKILYGFLIVAICATIVWHVDKLFRISLHTGIRYFRNAFFFYGLAFFFRYFFGALYALNTITWEVNLISLALFEFFLIVAGFSLLYSLLWRSIEYYGDHYTSSLFNPKAITLYLMALIMTLIDYAWGAYYVLFISQIIIFAIATGVSIQNYVKGEKKHPFLKWYVLAMLLSLLTWLLNAFAALFFEWDKGLLVFIHLFNALVFILFLYGVIRVTHMRQTNKDYGKKTRKA